MYNLETYYPTLENKQFYDKIDINRANIVYNHFDHFISRKNEIDNQRTILHKIITNCQLGLPSEYNYPMKNRNTKDKRGFEHGRLFSSTSLQGLQRDIRNLIIDKDKCLDVDVINCHPCILYQIATILKLLTPTLDAYIINKEVLLTEIESKYNLTRSISKTIPLAIINGGIRSNTYKDITWLKDLEDEIKVIYNALLNAEIGKRIVTHIKTVNKRNANGELIRSDGTPIRLLGSTINLLLCKIENEILTQCVLFFQSKMIEVYTLCFDGLIVSKFDNVSISQLEQHIYKTLGLIIHFKINPFENSDELFNSIPPAIHEDNSIMDIDFTNDGITFICAPLSYGKSTQLYDYLKQKLANNFDTRVLILTPRKSLSKELLDKFKTLGFDHYEDTFRSSRLICQIDSIYKIIRLYDVIILDEIESIIDRIVSSDQKEDTLFILESIIQYSTQTFIMDANLSDNTKSLFNFKDKKITDLIFTYKTFKGKSCEFVIDSNSENLKKHHGDFVIKSLKEGKKVACPVSSSKHVERLMTAVSLELPDCKILPISRKHPFNSANEFVNYDLVIYTSTLICEDIFYQKHFDIIIPYITNKRSSTNQYFQQILHIRQFDLIVIFIYLRKYGDTMVSESKILTRWKLDYNERMDKGIKYAHSLDQFRKDFYFQVTLNYTLEMENATFSLLHNLYQILSNHGFIISKREIESDHEINKLDKYDKKADFINVIEAEPLTKEKLNKNTYSSFEYAKYIIEKTFNVTLNEGMIDFVASTHDKIASHNNFMILYKYNIDQAIYIHERCQVAELSQYSIFIPKSKTYKHDLAQHRKALEFIKKYDIMKYLNTDQQFIINNKEFIKYFKIPKERDANMAIPKTINYLLKIHGLRFESKRIRDGDDRKREYHITTLIDYDQINIEPKKLTRHNFYNFDTYVAEMNQQ